MTKKRKTETSPTPKNYLEFIQKIGLQGVGLDAASVKVDRDLLAKAASDGEASAVSLDASFTVLQHSEERLVAGATFKLHQTAKNSDVPILLIECSFSALFHLGTSADQNLAERFVNTEAKLVFWPYLRHFIADTSYRMAINPILLPLITASNGDSKKK